MGNKQTAVEWLAEQMMHPQIHNPYIEQAKQMEKEQIKYAYDEGDIQLVNAEQYYNETFKSQNITLQNQSESKVITELSEAISILKIHQAWRLGADIVMIEPKELTEAIDTLNNCEQLATNCSQLEISDKEIEKRVKEVGAMGEYYKMGYRDAIIWYREQFKKK